MIRKYVRIDIFRYTYRDFKVRIVVGQQTKSLNDGAPRALQAAPRQLFRP